MRVLIVGPDNVRLSPLIAALLFEQIALRSIPNLHVASAGLHGADEPLDPLVSELLADRRIDMSRKRSRRVSPELIEPADVVLTTDRSVANRLIVDYVGLVARCLPFVAFCRDLTARTPHMSGGEWVRAECGSTRRAGVPDATVDLVATSPADRLDLFEIVDVVLPAVSRFVDAGWPSSVGQ